MVSTSFGFAGVLFFLDDLGAGVSSASLADVSFALTGVLPFFVLGVGSGSVAIGSSESSVWADVLTDFAFLVGLGDTSSMAVVLLDYFRRISIANLLLTLAFRSLGGLGFRLGGLLDLARFRRPGSLIRQLVYQVLTYNA